LSGRPFSLAVGWVRDFVSRFSKDFLARWLSTCAFVLPILYLLARSKTPISFGFAHTAIRRTDFSRWSMTDRVGCLASMLFSLSFFICLIFCVFRSGKKRLLQSMYENLSLVVLSLSVCHVFFFLPSVL
jgi:hypothetical protein